MMKSTYSLFLMSILLLLGSCATQTAKNEITSQEEISPLAKELEEAFPEGRISAHSKDKDKRLNFLKKLITEKSNQLEALEAKAKKSNVDAEEELQAELLTNEILLLEAYRYGIEEDLDLGEVQTP